MSRAAETVHDLFDRGRTTPEKTTGAGWEPRVKVLNRSPRSFPTGTPRLAAALMREKLSGRR